MSVRIDLKVDLEEATKHLEFVTAKVLRQAVARSINRTFTGLQSQVTQVIRRERLVDTRELPVSKIKERYLRSHGGRANASQSIDEMFAAISISDKHPSVRVFFAKRRSAGRSTTYPGAKLFSVRVRIMGRDMTLNDRTFWPVSRSGREWPILKRVSANPRAKLEKRFGPSFAYMMDKLGLVTELQDWANERLATEMSQNLDFYLKRGK